MIGVTLLRLYERLFIRISLCKHELTLVTAAIYFRVLIDSPRERPPGNFAQAELRELTLAAEPVNLLYLYSAQVLLNF